MIPVLDLRDGLAVHAVRGQRAAYAPVRSALAPSADPLALARAFRTHLGCAECYVADLDAIEGRGHQGPTVRAIAQAGLAVWLDAGAATPSEARRAAGHGAARVIVGTETLRDPGRLRAIVAALRGAGPPPPPGCALSFDLRDGRLLGGSPAVERQSPLTLAHLAWEAGIRAFIVLDLARVGTGEGVQTEVALRLRRALPGAEMIVGGGVRDRMDLSELERLGFDGALVATALHTGAITFAAGREED